MDADRRLGLSLAAGGAAPFAVGALIPASTVVDGPTLCPFRVMTGLPCPLCGATRAFVLAGHGDGGFVDYGAFWVLVAALTVVAGLVVLAAGSPALRAAWRSPRRAGTLAAALLALGWTWALAHQETITA